METLEISNCFEFLAGKRKWAKEGVLFLRFVLAERPRSM